MSRRKIEWLLYFSAFHSVSAFCNAGFSTLPGGIGNEMVMHNHNFLYIVLSMLIVFGGIGFPILVNMKDTLFYYLRHFYSWIFHRRRRFIKKNHLYNLNTKIVLFMTAVLLLAGTLIILLFEWNNAFSGMDTADKVVHASVDDNNYVFKFAVPAKLVVYKISELNSEQEFRLRIISVVMGKQTSNFFGISKKEYVSTIDYSEDYDLKEEDGLVCYGRYSDFMKFWKSVK